MGQPNALNLAEIQKCLWAQARERHRPVSDDHVAERWESDFDQLPLAPSLKLTRRQLARKVFVRAEKDRRLKKIILQLTGSVRAEIYNPCSVFGRHARDLARWLPRAQINASDIDPTWERLFQLRERISGQRSPANYAFSVSDVYAGLLSRRAPNAVVAFGACGSLADGVLDAVVSSRAQYVVLRACCHENLSMNTVLSTRAWSAWHVGHRLKNLAFSAQHRKKGFYGNDRFTISAYPRSEATRRLLGERDMLYLAQHAVDCALCRLVIDVDRGCYLQEHGYELLGFRHSMAVATLKRAEDSQFADVVPDLAEQRPRHDAETAVTLG